MFTSNKIKHISLAIGLTFMNVISFGQEATPVQVDRPVYEELGISSTVLATIMILFTAILIGFVISMSGSVKNILEFKNDKFKGGVKAILLLFGLGGSSATFAADGGSTEGVIPFPDSAFWTFLVVDIILVMIIVYLSGIIRGIASEYTSATKVKLFKKRLKRTLTDAVPVEDEASILLDHDYDGIRELDNNLPPWWKYGFYITIVWSIGYLFYYNVLKIGPSQAMEYKMEMEEGERQIAEYKAAHPELITAENVELLTDEASIRKGRELFNASCASCHMDGGKGGIGPNLTDKYWIYDGDIQGVFTTISEGAQNGMIAWKDLMPANDIQAVASYIMQLDYVAPPNGKEPQGENIVE